MVNAICRWVILCVMCAPLVYADEITVTVHGMGVDRPSAVQDALERALPIALGSEVFYVGHGSRSNRGVFSTVITRGLVSAHEVLEEIVTHNGVRVEVKITINPDGIKERPIHHFKRWEDVAIDAAHIEGMFQRLERYRELLADFLGTPEQQINRGYAIVPRGYQIHTILEHVIRGELLIDVIVNESWWNTYYALIRSLTPVTGNLILDGGPLESGIVRRRSVAGVIHPDNYVTLDKSLKEDVAGPIMVDIGIRATDFSRRIVLHKNTLSQGVRLNWFEDVDTAVPGALPYLDFNLESIPRGQAPLQIPWPPGQVGIRSGEPEGPIINVDESDLTCSGSHREGTYQVFCGRRFTLRLPIHASDVHAFKQLLNRPISINAQDAWHLRQ